MAFLFVIAFLCVPLDNIVLYYVGEVCVRLTLIEDN